MTSGLQNTRPLRRLWENKDFLVPLTISVLLLSLQQSHNVMGAYINIGNAGFQSVRNGEYVDKSGLISIVNGTLFTERRFSCVSRSRRFGKSVAAKMLCAYYDHRAIHAACSQTLKLLETLRSRST